jgi:tripartite-type tricarboxylate transporter receptor subunit TctC
MGIVVRILFACALTLVGVATQLSPARAQGYPSKPITVIVPFGPGSATDTICRIVTQQLAANLNASIVIENKVGANGAIAGAYVARSTPDGYTLLMATNSPLSAAPSLNKTMTYDPVKDFVGLSRVGSYTFTLAINKDIPAQNLRELIAYAKANPGKLSHASGNSSGLVAGETFKTAAGLDILHVPYRSAPPAMNDLLANRVSMMFTDLTIGLPHIRSGALRGLATTRMQRSTLLPDLPTLDEAGVKGFDMDSWAGLFAPAGTPPDVVAKLNAELRKVIDHPDIKAKIAVLGFEAFSSSTEELNEHVKVQLVKWTKMIKDAGIEPE